MQKNVEKKYIYCLNHHETVCGYWWFPDYDYYDTVTALKLQTTFVDFSSIFKSWFLII